MSEWLLIWVFSTQGFLAGASTSTGTEVFKNQAECEFAVETLEKSDRRIDAVCVERSSE